MISFRLESPDLNLTVGDKLNVSMKVQNGLPVRRKFTIDVQIIIDGQQSDFPLPCEKEYTINPNQNMTIYIFENMDITSAWGSLPETYIMVYLHDKMTGRSYYDTLALNIETRELHIQGKMFFHGKRAMKKILIPFHYGAINQTPNGPVPTPSSYASVMDEVKTYWPEDFMIRCWTFCNNAFGWLHSPVPWVKENGKFNLEKWNDVYLQRIVDYADVHKQYKVPMVLDIWDRWSMDTNNQWVKWSDHCLHPNNNHQRTYGIPVSDTALPYFFQTNSYPQLWEFQKRFIAKLNDLLKDNDWIIFSTGNETFGGSIPYGDLVEWHSKSTDYIKQLDRTRITSVNPLNEHREIYSLTNVDMCAFHNCAGLQCNNSQDWGGNINWSNIRQFNKPMKIDNDGLWVCRSVVDNVVDWYLEVKNGIHEDESAIYACKLPFPGDDPQDQENWDDYGKPCLIRLGQVA